MAGFQKLPHWFMREYQMDPYERLVYLTLRSHADKHGIAYPSRATLATETGLSDTTVRKRLQDLVAHGLVRRTTRPKRGAKHDSNLYHVLELGDEPPTTSGEVGQDWGQETPPVGAGDAPSGGAGSPHLGASDAPEVEPQEVEPQEEDLRPEQGLGRAPSPLGTFIDPQEPCTKAQREYLGDLQLHLNRASPDEELLEYWGDLTRQQATDLINQYLRQIPRHSSYDGPVPGEDVYERLSDRGREFADRQLLPTGHGSY